MDDLLVGIGELLRLSQTARALGAGGEGLSRATGGGNGGNRERKRCKQQDGLFRHHGLSSAPPKAYGRVVTPVNRGGITATLRFAHPQSARSRVGSEPASREPRRIR